MELFTQENIVDRQFSFCGEIYKCKSVYGGKSFFLVKFDQIAMKWIYWCNVELYVFHFTYRMIVFGKPQSGDVSYDLLLPAIPEIQIV